MNSKNMGKSPPKAFRIDREEVLRYLRLQEETSLKVWFAIMSVQEDTVTNDIHFLPVDRVQQFMATRHWKHPEWDYVQVPLNCFTDCAHLAHNICGRCKYAYCGELDEILKVDDEIHEVHIA